MTLDGIGPATARRLRSAGVESVADLARADPAFVLETLSGLRGMSIDRVRSFVDAAASCVEAVTTEETVPSASRAADQQHRTDRVAVVDAGPLVGGGVRHIAVTIPSSVIAESGGATSVDATAFARMLGSRRTQFLGSQRCRVESGAPLSLDFGSATVDAGVHRLMLELWWSGSDSDVGQGQIAMLAATG